MLAEIRTYLVHFKPVGGALRVRVVIKAQLSLVIAVGVVFTKPLDYYAQHAPWVSGAILDKLTPHILDLVDLSCRLIRVAAQ